MKIKCPHCGATNQDVSENDPCWQCGTILSAPPSALETEEGPPTSAANPTSQPPAPKRETPAAQSQFAPLLQRTDLPPTTPSSARRTNMGVVIAVILVLVAVIVVAVLLLRPH
ncbi:MAG TPA: hypothetical protein VKU00_30715 [Chthonomonadaceae bacterium]|nr:hypothetical protein [Chthonomonadaceae bacterium]